MILQNEKITFEDDRLDKRTAFQNMAYFMALIFNFFQLLFVAYVVCFIVQRVATGFTYFRPGGVPCEPYYNLTLPRFLFLTWVVVNVVCVKMGFGVGHKIWRRLSIIFSGAGAFFNVIFLAIFVFFFITTCNTQGSGALGNICNSRRFCGEPSAIADTTNQCQYVNPTLKPLQGLTSLTQLSWDNDFIFLFLFQCIYTGFALGQFVSGAILSGAVEAIYGGIMGKISDAKKVFNSTNNVDEKDMEKLAETQDELQQVEEKLATAKKGSQIYKILKLEKKNLTKAKNAIYSSAKKIMKNIASDLRFFDMFSTSLAFLYVLSVFLDILVTLGFIAWGGWFQQNVDSYREIWRETTPISAFSEYEFQPNTYNIIFYALFGLNTFTISGMIWLGDVYSNSGAIVSSAVGFVGNLALMLYSVVFHIRTCNANGVPYNPCTNLRGTYMAFATNPANDVAYADTCAAPFAPIPQPYPWDPSYVYFFILLSTLIVYYGFSLVLSITLEWTFRKKIQTAENNTSVAPMESSITSSDIDDENMSIESHFSHQTNYDPLKYLNADNNSSSGDGGGVNDTYNRKKEFIIIREHRNFYTDVKDTINFLIFRHEKPKFRMVEKKNE